MIFYTADLHFDYEPILANGNRPFSSISEMNEQLIRNWNAVVSDGDTVYLIGDICGHGQPIPTQHLVRLNGKKHLIRGNHDTGLEDQQQLFDHFETVTDFLEIDDRGIHILLCHYPIVYIQKGYMIHGHTHSTQKEVYQVLKPLSRVMNACVDINHFRPVTLEELVENNQAFYASAGRGNLEDWLSQKRGKWNADFRPLPVKQPDTLSASSVEKAGATENGKNEDRDIC